MASELLVNELANRGAGSRKRDPEHAPGTLFSGEGVEATRRTQHLENCIASTIVLVINNDSSYKGSLTDALALGADEGRSRLR